MSVTDNDIRHGLAYLERIAKAAERIADALEAANQADPLQMIERALAAKDPEDERVSVVPPGSTVTYAVPESERYRFR